MVKVVRDFTGARRDGRRAVHVAETPASELDPIQFPEHRSSGSPAPIPPQVNGSIEVSEASLFDLVRLRRIEPIYWLNQPEYALYGDAAPASPLEAAVRWSDVRPTVLVGREESRIVGYTEFRPVLPDLRWQLVAIGSSSGREDPRADWIPMLDQGTRAAGSHGVKRLYARAPEATPVGEALYAAGYSAYANEVIFVAGEPVAQSPGIDAREQERADTWAVHQLYNSSVPKEVLHAEAYTSHRWELPRGRLRSRQSTRAWIAEVNQSPVAYVRCTSANRRYVLDVIFEPGSIDDAAGLIDTVLRKIEREGPTAQVFCTVRGYSKELERVLLERHFEPWMNQDLFIRYTTAPLRVMTAEMVFSDAEAVERARRRVPAYLASVENND